MFSAVWQSRQMAPWAARRRFLPSPSARITSALFDVPTTMAASDGSFYLVNARFGTADRDAAEYTVVRIGKT